jgi:uncharacterized membrane protein YfcA
VEYSVLLLHAAVLIAALVQAATGVGFGLIAGPIILMVIDTGSAIQVTILLSLLVALLLAPPLYKHSQKPLLCRLILGTLIGLPLGIFVFMSVSINSLKLGVGVCVVLTAIATVRSSIRNRKDKQQPGNRVHDVLTGILSGAMSVSLAMPGPPAAARMVVLGLPKDMIRATSLVLFTFSYSAAIAFQWTLVGIAGDTLSLTLSLMPSTLTGIYIGRKTAGWISERTFQWLIAAILGSTALSLLIHSVRGLIDHT